MASSAPTSPDPLSSTVLSTTLRQLWLEDTESNTTVVSILKTHSHLCFSAIYCLQNTKIFSRILKKQDKLKPKCRFQIKIANLLVKHNLISKNLLRRRAKTIEANLQTGNKAIIQCKLNNVAQNCLCLCLNIQVHVVCQRKQMHFLTSISSRSSILVPISETIFSTIFYFISCHKSSFIVLINIIILLWLK